MPDWFTRSPVYKRRFHFRVRIGRPNRTECTAVERFRLPLVQFPRDVSISVGRRAPFRCIQFRDPLRPPPLPPSHPHLRDTYRRCQIPLFSIRWWINSSYPKLSYAVYDCCIRSRRKLRLPVAMERNDLQRSHISLSLYLSLLSLKECLCKWILRKRFFFWDTRVPEGTRDFQRV